MFTQGLRLGSVELELWLSGTAAQGASTSLAVLELSAAATGPGGSCHSHILGTRPGSDWVAAGAGFGEGELRWFTALLNTPCTPGSWPLVGA